MVFSPSFWEYFTLSPFGCLDNTTVWMYTCFGYIHMDVLAYYYIQMDVRKEC